MLRVSNLSKYYGHRPALRDLNFEVSAGSRVGLLGLNGAGKSTLLRVISGVVDPSTGECLLSLEGRSGDIDLGKAVLSTDAGVSYRRHVGFLGDTRELYDDLTVRDLLRFVAKIRSGERRRATIKERIDRVVSLSDLGSVFRQRVGTLSLGFRKRVALACAVIHEPELLLLDEPFSGLDPLQCRRFVDRIQKLRPEVTLIISSHMVDLIAECAEKAIVIRSGEISYDGVFNKTAVMDALA